TDVDAMLTDRELTKLISKFLRSLKRQVGPHALEYLSVNEWAKGHRHHHFLIRTEARLTTGLFGEVLTSACSGLDIMSHYCAPVENAEASARYLFKRLKDDRKAELVPESFGGHVYS